MNEELEPEDREEDVDGKAEAWNAANNPAAADRTFLYFANQLPLSGAGPSRSPATTGRSRRTVST